MIERKYKLNPFPLFRGCHEQTIFGSMLNFHPEPKSRSLYVPFDDGDTMVLKVSTPKGWKRGGPIVMMVHGLAGSDRSVYLIRMTRKLMARGIKTVRVNLRGCGSGRGLSRYMFPHFSDKDLCRAAQAVKASSPDSTLQLVGFSLGGNYALKAAGKSSRRGEKLFDQVIAVSPPVYVETSSSLLGRPENRIYERYFTKLLRDEALRRIKSMKLTDASYIPENLSIRQFDDFFTAPHLGLSSAEEYYARSSSKKYLCHVKMPVKILYSLDDPIIDASALDDLTLPDHVEIHKTNKGGHMGFLGTPFSNRGFRWMDSMLLDWLSL
ncbi:MAG: alpha/beta fold hydrolase [Candidatus Algichlamydia australiensis]|nr:alpha/beta fold hydrolase [Chlamydiales bacterium]